MKNVLFISHTSYWGGAENSLYTLIKGLDKREFQAFVVLPNDGELNRRLKLLEIRTLICPIMRWVAFYTEYNLKYRVKFFAKLVKRINIISEVIKREQIDVVYTNTITPIEGAIAARVNGIPHIWHIREILQNDSTLKPILPIRFTYKIVAYLSDRIIVISNAQKSHIMAYIAKNNNSKLLLIYNGVNISDFEIKSKNERDCFRKKLGLSEQSLLVGCIGSLNERKAQTDLVETARIVTNRLKDVYFIMVGDGDSQYISQIRSKICEYNLQKRVIIYGPVKDIAPVYNSIDLLVSTSRVEPFGRTIIEAMAAEKPVIAVRAGGPEEIIIEGKTGFLVSKGDIEMLADSIVKLLSDDKMIKRMGQAGKDIIKDRFTSEIYIKNVQKVINSV